MRSRVDLIRLGLVATVVLVVDQVSKFAVRDSLYPGEIVELPGPFSITLSFNDGVAFGLGGGSGVPVVIFSLVALALLAFFISGAPSGWTTAIAGGLILGGAVGNLIDRLLEGEVTDFVSLPWWPTFNVADVGITVGVVLLVISVLRGDSEKPGEGRDV